MTQENILSQAGVAVLAQANQMPSRRSRCSVANPRNSEPMTTITFTGLASGLDSASLISSWSRSRSSPQRCFRTSSWIYRRQKIDRRQPR